MVALLQAPPEFAFSGNFIPVKFSTDNYLEQAGSFSKNVVSFNIADPADLTAAQQYIVPGDTITIKYAANTIVMTASNAPDDSGTQFITGIINAAYVQNVLQYFNANYRLSADFDLSVTNTGLYFTAKKKLYGMDFESAVSAKFVLANNIVGSPVIPRPNFAIYFALYLENASLTGYDKVYENRLLLKFGTNGQAQTDIADTLDNILKSAGPDFTPANDMLQCNNSCRRYYFRYAESYGDEIAVYAVKESPKYTVVAGELSYQAAAYSQLIYQLQPGFADQSKDRFLKQGKAQLSTRSNQPQFLYYLNTRATRILRLKIKYYFNAGPAVEVIKHQFNCEKGRKYAFDLSFDQIFNSLAYPGKTVVRYECWLETTAAVIVSQLITYWLDYQYREFVRFFLYWSSWGSMDSMMCCGKGSADYELTQQIASVVRQSGYLITDGDRKAFDTRLNSGFKITTGWISREQLELNRDFFRADCKYRYFKSRLLPITVTSATIPEQTDGGNALSQAFDYKYLFDEDAFSENETEEPGTDLEDFIFPSGGYGKVKIIDQHGTLIAEVSAPGTFTVFRFDRIVGGQAETTYELTITA